MSSISYILREVQIYTTTRPCTPIRTIKLQMSNKGRFFLQKKWRVTTLNRKYNSKLKKNLAFKKEICELLFSVNSARIWHRQWGYKDEKINHRVSVTVAKEKINGLEQYPSELPNLNLLVLGIWASSQDQSWEAGLSWLSWCNLKKLKNLEEARNIFLGSVPLKLA